MEQIDIENLNPDQTKKILSDIVQAYRIRLKILMRRSKLLESIRGDLSKVDQRFFRVLMSCLAREERLVKIIRIELGPEESKLTYAINVVKQLMVHLEKSDGMPVKKRQSFLAYPFVKIKLWILKIRHRKRLKNKINKKKSFRAIYKFLNQTYMLLKIMEKDLKIIQERMKIEKDVLAKATIRSDKPRISKYDPTLVSSDLFNEYLRALYLETNSNLEAIKHFRKMHGSEISTRDITLLYTASGLALANIILSPSIAGTLIVTASIFIWFTGALSDVYNKEFFRGLRDEQVIGNAFYNSNRLKKRLRKKLSL